MDDLTRYVLISFVLLAAWFVLALVGGYVFGRHVERRKRLFKGHQSEEVE